MIDKNDIRLIIEQLKKELIPVGSILIFSSKKVPDNFLPCDGRELSKQLYPELYALIGNTWGETETTFFLPNLQGQFVRGWDSDGNVDPERDFGSYQEDTFQGHAHKIKFEKDLRTDNAGEHQHYNYYHSHQVSDAGGLRSEYGVWEVSFGDSSDNYFNGRGMTSEGEHNHYVGIKVNENTREIVNSTFGIARVSIETRPKNIAVLYCIKAN